MLRSLLGRFHGPAADDRRIFVAFAVSLLLHVPLFLAAGIWQLGPLSDADAPALTVLIESTDTAATAPVAAAQSAPSPESLPATPTVEPEPQEPTPEVEEALVADAETGTPEHITEPVEGQAEEQVPTEDPTSPAEGLADTEQAMAAADLAETPGELSSPDPEPAIEDVPATEPVLATVAPAHERVLTRRLEREANALLRSSEPQRQLTFKDDGREYTAVLTRRPAADPMSLERLHVEITTEHGGQRARTSLQMKRLAFSHFTQLIDRWDPAVQLHDDEISGRFHSNTEVLLTYDHEAAPRLLGKTTTPRGVRFVGEKGYRSRRKIFVGGLDTRAERVSLPPIALPIAQAHATHGADVHVVRGGTSVVFHPEGFYEAVDHASGEKVRRTVTPGRATYVVGAREAELHVRGVITGNVAVYSPKRILIQGDLTYAHPDAHLALISDGNVEIDRADVTGPGDLDIHAAVYARKRFVVRNVRARRAGTLYIHGSLTAGSVSETEPRYATRIEFDPRFENARPPGFPETDRYEVEAWDGRWRLAEAPEGE